MDLVTPLMLAATFSAGLDAPPPHPALYSFADVYQLTVSGAAPAPDPLAGGTMLVEAALSPAAPAPRFTVSPPGAPGGWALVVSGLALAGWVAHRRLVHPL